MVLEGVIVPAALAAAVKWWPETPIGRLILIPRPQSPDEVLPETENYRLQNLVGKRGTARGTMLPSGLVVIEGRTYDAVSEGKPIEAGETVLVVAISTQRLVVRQDNTIRAELADTTPTPAAATSADPLAQTFADPFSE